MEGRGSKYIEEILHIKYYNHIYDKWFWRKATPMEVKEQTKWEIYEKKWRGII